MKRMKGPDADYARLRDVCQRYGIARLDVFGSASRGDMDPDSDIDLLYTLAPATLSSATTCSTRPGRSMRREVGPGTRRENYALAL